MIFTLTDFFYFKILKVHFAATQSKHAELFSRQSLMQAYFDL